MNRTAESFLRQSAWGGFSGPPRFSDAMNFIDKLNARLGERLGFCGRNPRFIWQNAKDVFYYYRDGPIAEMKQFCWASRLGPVWMLCQWRRPTWLDRDGKLHTITRGDWWGMFHGSFPYPERGQYYAQPETTLAPGRLPDDYLTDAYIHYIDQQMTLNYAAHKRQIDAEIAADEERRDSEWVACVQDTNPAFSNFEPGTKCGTEFQVPGLKPEPKALRMQ
jgi:hypothetical protein